MKTSKLSTRTFAPRLASKVLLSVATVVSLLGGFAIARTVRYRSTSSAIETETEIKIPESAAERLAGSLRFSTISPEDSAAFDGAAFLAMHRYLHAVFPRVHSQLRRETVRTYSLLYMWQGSDPSLKPILLMGHLDVVPAGSGIEEKWQEDPFSGRISGGFIWGRGAIDNKSAVMGTLEAVELLLSEGFTPARTVYLAYGHDEEVGGTQGAKQIAALLRSRGVRFETVLDEGGVIGEGIFPNITMPVALVGIAEKGFVSVELSTHGTGGHSSLPPRQSTIGILSAAIRRVEEHPMPARLEEPTRRLFDQIGPNLPFAQRAVFANLWVTRGLVMRKLEDSPTTNAMVRTTTAATIFRAGAKDNLLPSYARAVINSRILPGDRAASVLEHLRRVIDDTRVEVKPVGRFSAEPSAVSRTDTRSFRIIERAIRRTAPDAIVAPYLVVVVTDSRYFADLSENIFRFQPVRLNSADLARMHGIDERIPVRQYQATVRAYRRIIRDSARI